MNKILVGIIVGMFALALTGWAAANRSTQHANTLAKRVARLERIARLQVRINLLTGRRLTSLENHKLSVRKVFAFGSTDSNGAASATAFCGLDSAVGGGASFLGTSYVGDRMLYSYPNGNGWSAAAAGPTGAGRTFEAWVVCAD